MGARGRGRGERPPRSDRAPREDRDDREEFRPDRRSPSSRDDYKAQVEVLHNLQTEASRLREEGNHAEAANYDARIKEHV